MLIVGTLGVETLIGHSRYVDGVVDADALVDVECDGHGWCHASIDIGHSTRQRFDSLGTVSLAAVSRLSSCPSICPPLVRSAPGFLSFPPCVVPLPSFLRILR